MGHTQNVHSHISIQTCERVCGGRTRGNTNCGLIRTEYHRSKKKKQGELTYSNLLRYEIFNIKSVVIQRERKCNAAQNRVHEHGEL